MWRYIHIPTDLALVGLATLLAFVLRNNMPWWHVTMRQGFDLYLFTTLIASFVCFPVSGASNRIWRYFSFIDGLRLILVIGLVVMLAWSMTFIINRAEAIPRSVPLIQWSLASFFLLAARSVVRFASASHAISETSTSVSSKKQHVLIIGMNDIAELYIRCTKQLSAKSISVVGILDKDNKLTGRMLNSAKILGTPEQIQDIVNDQSVHGINIDTIVVAVPFDSLSRSAYEALIAYEKRSGKPFEMIEERLEFSKAESDVKECQGVSIVASANAQKDMGPSRPQKFIKRGIDIIGASVLIGLLAPLIALVWGLTLVNVGSPAIFWQVRPGYRGRIFRVLKFRTMRGAHDSKGHRIPDSKRSSVLGTAMRLYRLDELPQLLNILKGDMSFIGPRPLLPVDQPASAEIRLSVRPGLTGWAQVNGGRALSVEDKAALDAWYVKNISLRLDLEIAFRTFVFLVKGEQPPQKHVLIAARECVQRAVQSI